MANYFYPLEAGREAWNSSITPKWTITEQKSASGRRRAVSQQYYPNWVIKLSYKALTQNEVDILLSFYNARRGAFEPFYYKDYTYHKINAQTLPKNTDGTYQLIANIGGYVEPVYVVENLVVYLANGQTTRDYTERNGKITIATTEVITADYDYYLKVHFSGDISITQVLDNIYNVSVTLEGVR